MRPYVSELLERLADQTPTASSADSVSWAAHREAEKLEDIAVVDELAETVTGDRSKRRRAGCYFVIGKIGRNLKEPRCARLLLSLLDSEKDKYNIASILEHVGEIPKPAEFDLSAVYARFGDSRWLVRHAAMRALDNTVSRDAEDRLLRHLAETDDPVDKTCCHAVLNRIGTHRSVLAIQANLTSRKRDVKKSAEAALRAIRARGA